MGIRATRVPGTGRGWRGPEAARYATAPMWPGWTAGHTARCQCTWAPLDGRWQVKVAYAACPEMRAHKAAGR